MKIKIKNIPKKILWSKCQYCGSIILWKKVIRDTFLSLFIYFLVIEMTPYHLRVKKIFFSIFSLIIALENSNLVNELDASEGKF